MTKRIKTRKKHFDVPRSLQRLFPNVEHAVDATNAIEIAVHANDCKVARKKDPTECALAKAAKRELHADGVIIGLGASYIIKGKEAIRFTTPERIRREIVSFDRHQDFEAGTYSLTPPSPSVRLGPKSHQKSGGKNKNPTRKLHRSARVRFLNSDKVE